MWMNIPLNVSGWENVSPALRNVTVVHLKNKFDLDKRSASNKGVRAQQVVVNRGGSCSYSNACFKEDITRIEAFRKANTDRQGVFSSPAVEQQYNALLLEISQQTQASSQANGTTTDTATATITVGNASNNVKRSGMYRQIDICFNWFIEIADSEDIQSFVCDNGT
ncbi:unnamed protein product [Lactuca virosa]|uniref:Uncharacterized protein n=1 Tax=Lactuca virosa TaxID=75947 RepID=A0AAU9MMK4_9ASTR|nr:unnamed protein product [Lactuca virosa]